MSVRITVTALVALFLFGCSDGGEVARKERVAAFMKQALEPSADVIWDSAGWVITKEGETELWPTTDEGWGEIVSHAENISEAGRILQQADYAYDTEDWVDISQGLIEAGQRIQKAAETRDKDELFDAGGHLYRVCLSCHSRYWIK